MSSGTLLRCIMAIALLVLMASGQVARAEDQAPRDGVFLHISHGVDKPHRVLMALSIIVLLAPTLQCQ